MFLFLNHGITPDMVLMEVDVDGLFFDEINKRTETGAAVAAAYEWEKIPPDAEDKVEETEEELCLSSE